MIGRVGYSRLFASTADHTVGPWIFADWNTLMRQIRNFQKQIVLLLLGDRCSFVKVENFVAYFSDTGFEFGRCTASGAFCTDLFAQASALRVQVLQSSLEFSAFAIDTNYFVYFPPIIATPRRKPLTNRVRFLPDQTNIEHDADCSISISPVSESIADAESLRYSNAAS